MGFLGFFKKKEPTKEPPAVQEIDSGLKYRDIPVIITFEPELSKEHIEEDFAVLNKKGIDDYLQKLIETYSRTKGITPLDKHTQ